MTPNLITSLQEAAEKATPGKWETMPASFSPRTFIMRFDPTSDEQAIAVVTERPDAAFIAAANPSAILELIASHKRMEAEIERLRKALQFYADSWTFKANKRYGGLEWSPTEALLDDCGNTARSALTDNTKENEHVPG
jgi:hypothetical protein